MSKLWECTVPEGTSGPWKVEKFTITKDCPSFLFGSRAPFPGDYTRLMRHGTCVMSDTYAEYRDHSWFIHNASGRVLIAGLGLGLVLQKVAENPNVSEIVVVELSQDVINLVWDHVRSKITKPVTLLQGSILDKATIPKELRGFNSCWFDIWDHICTDNLPEMAQCRRMWARGASVKGCWADALCKRQERESQRRKAWFR